MKKVASLGFSIPLILSVLLMGGWVASVEWQKQHSSEVFLKIKGFDPRDLLSGHYLRYQVDFGSTVICSPQAGARSNDVCVCVEDGATFKQAATRFAGQDCSESNRPKCKTFLKGRCEYGTFRGGFERYYFPEQYAKDLFVVPAGAVIRAKVNHLGKVIVDELFIADVPLLDYLAELESKRLVTPEPTELSPTTP